MSQDSHISSNHEAYIALTEAEGFIRARLQSLSRGSPLLIEAHRILAKLENAKERLVPAASDDAHRTLVVGQLSFWEAPETSTKSQESAIVLT